MGAGAADSSPAEWTVLVYMAANGDLDPAAEACLSAMMSAPRSDAIHLAVQIRRPGPHLRAPTTTRYHVRGALVESTPVVPSASMGEKKTLTDFIDWALGAYPARRSLLVVWSHGGGLEDVTGARKLALDGGEFLTNQAFREAIAESAAGRVDVLGCDACLMSMVEVAYEMRGVASFFVASEADEPTQSWPYAPILASLAADASMAPEALSRGIVRAFETWYGNAANPNDLGYATQVAVALAATDGVAAAVDALAAALVAALPDALPTLQDARTWAPAMEIPDYVDLGGLLDLLGQGLPGSDVAAAVQRVQDALGAARLAACAVGPGATGASGLAIYFPTAKNAAGFPGYKDLAFAATRWPAFLQAYFEASGVDRGLDVLRGDPALGSRGLL